MIAFKSLRIEGFCSFVKPFTYSGLNKPGINIIEGKNGTGKSTIFAALYWCLYGKLVKDKASITPWPSLISDDFKGTMVGLTFIKGKDKYKVIRCHEYKKDIAGARGKNRVVVYKNGEVEQLGDKRDVNAYIQTLIGVSPELFRNAILFGQNLTRLLRESGPEQKRIFDEVFDITWINEVRKKVTEDQRKYTTLSYEASQLVATTEMGISNMESMLEEKSGFKAYIINNRDKEIEKLKEELADNRSRYRKAVTSRDKLNHYVSKAGELGSKRKFYRDKLKGEAKVKERISEVKANLPVVKSRYQEMGDKARDLVKKIGEPINLCIACGQPIDKEKAQEQRLNLQTELGKVRQKLVEDEHTIDYLEKAIKRLELDIRKYSKYLTSLSEIERDLAENQQVIQKLTLESKMANGYLKSIKIIKGRINETESDGKIKALEKEIKELLKEKAKGEKALQNLRNGLESINEKLSIQNWLLGDPLSNKGLKAFIFNTMVDLINQRLEHYYRFLGFQVILDVDIESGNKNFQSFIHKRGSIVNYQDLSGGEQQLVDICIAFSINDLVRKNVGIPLLLMDEIFESLDEDNVSLVSDLIVEKSRDISMHLITHNLTLSSSLPDANILRL